MPSTPIRAQVTRNMLFPLSLGSLLLAGTLLAMHTPPAQARQFGAGDPDLADDAPAQTNRLIVKYKSGSANGRRSALSAGHPVAQSLRPYGLTAQAAHVNAQGAQVLRLNRFASDPELREVARALMRDDPNVLYAEPDHLMRPQATPNDPMYASQWHYFEAKAGLNLPLAWDLSTGSGVVVAVLDTGVRPHVDLAANLLSGYDFISDTGIGNDGNGRDSDANDPGDGCSSGSSSWHGTHVAGTIAAVSNNGVGVAGVAWNAKILPVRVLGCGGGYNSDIADGIIWAAGGSVSGVSNTSTPAKVINMSLGGQSACSTTVQNAITAARNFGAVVVVAAGNSNMAVNRFSPANCKGVVTVAALGRTAARAPYSNFGPEVDVAAPGGNMAAGTTSGILSTLNSGGASAGSDNYQYYQGTSMATPHVAGAAALMLGRNGRLTPDEIEVLLKSTVRRFPVVCSGCGVGIVDAAKAVSTSFAGSTLASAGDEYEPNDSHAQAQAIGTLPTKISASISRVGDLDTYKLTIAAGAIIKARLISSTTSDYNLALRNAKNAVVLLSKRGTGLTDAVTWRNTGRTTVTMFLRVGRASGGVGESAGKYTLEVTH